MEVRTIRLNGVDVQVEVAEVAVLSDSDLELTSRLGESLLDSGAEVRQLLQALAKSVQEAFTAAAPNEWGIEVTLGFKGETGVPFLAKGEANGALKVSAKWTKA